MKQYRTANTIMDEAYSLARVIRAGGADGQDARDLAAKVVELKEFMDKEFCVFYHP